MSLKLKSHVGRDLLDAASKFPREDVVVWEYVVNGLQYVDPGVKPRVQVDINPHRKCIRISDNGRGMSSADLQRFFTMHAENIDRQRGKMGRGKFGTGKSAAFGIARTLVVEARQNRLRNVVRLDRETIDASSGDEIPLEWRVKDEATDLPNGTAITVDDIVLTKIDLASVIKYIEKHLQPFRAIAPEVAVGHHVCSYREPSFVEELSFKPSPKQAKLLGDVELTIKVSQGPLGENDCGVLVTAGPGATVAQEDGGVCRKEMGNYLFGEIDVPSLELSDSPLEPYDSTRRLKLNPQHPVAAVLIGFIGSRLDETRQRLLKRYREEKKNEESRRLAKEAERIEAVLNGDFRELSQRLEKIRAASSSYGPAGALFGSAGTGGSESGDWVEGSTQPGSVRDTGRGGAEGTGGGGPAPDIPRSGSPDKRGDSAVDPVGGTEGERRRPRAGFRVDYRHLGEEEPDRSRYDDNTLTILINLDHRAVKAALEQDGVEGSMFRRLSYEIAFTEYAFALEYHRLDQDPDKLAADAVYDVRETLNRVAAAAADLYR